MPWYFFVKVLLSSVIIAGVSEIAKRNTFFGALTASLPLISLLALVWIYYETRDTAKIIDLSYGIFWLVLPSLALFLVLPWMLKMGVKFGWALLAASMVTALFYFLLAFLLKKAGFQI